MLGKKKATRMKKGRTNSVNCWTLEREKFGVPA